MNADNLFELFGKEESDLNLNKTPQSKNITISDWNVLVDTVEKSISDITRLYTYLKEKALEMRLAELTATDASNSDAISELSENYSALTTLVDSLGSSNVLNGTGAGSIVQKNGGVTGSNGVSVVADAKAPGKSAAALNARTEANGDSSGAGGYNAKAHTKADYAFNSGTAGLTEAEFNKLYPDGYNLSGTILDYIGYKTRVVSGAFACNSGKATGPYSFSAGSTTSDRGAQAPRSATFGNYCVVRYGYFDSSSGPLLGEGDNSFAGGDTVAIHGPNSFGYGKDLILPLRRDANGNRIPTAVFGRHNQYYHPNYTSPTIFEIGNGTSNDVNGLHNAFEVLDDGRAKVFGQPIDANDVVRLGDLDALEDVLNCLNNGGIA